MNDSRLKSLGMKEKICYGAGDIGQFDLHDSLYISDLFWTTVYGISAATATLSLVVEFGIDAVFIRSWDWWRQDKIKWDATVHGSYGDLYSSCHILRSVFYDAKYGDGGKLVWAYVMFFGMKTFFTAVNVPYGVMCNVMTQDIKERMSLSPLRTWDLTWQIFSVPTVFHWCCFGKGEQTQGYFKAAALLAVIIDSCA